MKDTEAETDALRREINRTFKQLGGDGLLSAFDFRVYRTAAGMLPKGVTLVSAMTN